MDVVIVGAGQAGASVAKSLRDAGHTGAIKLIGSERHLPYERPPLSKGSLSGEIVGTALVLSAADYATLGIDVICEKSVIQLDRLAHKVVCSDGSSYPYDKLVLTTGGRARKPDFPGNSLPGVHTLRTFEDSRAIAEKLVDGGRLLVIGGGWIGLEVAASARRKGMSVMLVEAGERLCARSVPPAISAFLYQKHAYEGVQIELNRSVRGIRAREDGKLQASNSCDVDEVIDLVVIGVGLEPNTELAVAAGLGVDNGIVVDTQGRTTDPEIFAAGDVANLPCSWSGGRLRLESWANAQNHGIAVGQAVAGQAVRYDQIPWFWSDQYDANIQMLGIFASSTEEVLRGDPALGKFTLFQLREGRLTAAASVNAARDMRAARRLIANRTEVDGVALADLTVPLDKL